MPFQHSDLEIFEHFAQLAFQLFIDRCLMLGFMLFVRHFDVEIASLAFQTLDHDLYIDVDWHKTDQELPYFRDLFVEDL